jgi:hypothetical protein
MKICLRGMFNNITNYYTKKKYINYVESILMDQLYNDLKSMEECKTAKDCQDYIKEFIDFYCLKDKKNV